MTAQQSREPEHSFTRHLKSKPSVRARLRQALCSSTKGMGTDISFLLERNRGDGWESPVDLLPQFPNAFQRSTVVEVCWWPARRALTDLFFGDTALIPFNSGLPEDLSPEVYDYCQLNFQDNDRLTGWLPTVSYTHLTLPTKA